MLSSGAVSPLLSHHGQFWHIHSTHITSSPSHFTYTPTEKCFSIVPKGHRLRWKYLSAYSLGDCRVMRLKINPCLVRKGPSWGDFWVPYDVWRSVGFCMWGSKSLVGLQDAELKARGAVYVCAVCCVLWLVLYPVRPFPAAHWAVVYPDIVLQW